MARSQPRASDTQDKAVPEWTEITPPYDPTRYPPPPRWSVDPDVRTDECKHDWPTEWGQKGERQRRCRHCSRWIWDRAWWPEVLGTEATEHD